MPKLIDITGQRYGRLVAISKSKNVNGRTSWLCKCDCGNMKNVTSNSLRRGAIKSCGCIRKEQASSRSKLAGEKRGRQLKKHGGSSERLYGVWKSMNQRCSNHHNSNYQDYGGRGIKVCDEWKNDYASFKKWALSKGYDSNAFFGECTLDRINNNGNYEPANCRFVNLKIQANNRRKRKSK